MTIALDRPKNKSKSAEISERLGDLFKGTALKKTAEKYLLSVNH